MEELVVSNSFRSTTFTKVGAKRRNSGQLSHTLTALGGGSSFDNNTSLNASLVTDDHRAGLYIFGQNRHRSGYDYDGDGFTELPKLKNQGGIVIE